MAHESMLTWTGNTLESYAKVAEARNPGGARLEVTAAAANGGDPGRMNPEELLATALSTCHMLFFLALAQKVRLEVTRYDDHAVAELETVDKVSRVKAITLSPVIRIAPGSNAAKAVEMFEKAHKYCIIANSVSCTIILSPRIVEG